MDDALPAILHAKVGEAESFHIVLESDTLQARVCLLDECAGRAEVLPALGRDVVVNGDEGAVLSAHVAVGKGQTFKGLRGGDLVHDLQGEMGFVRMWSRRMGGDLRGGRCRGCTSHRRRSA